MAILCRVLRHRPDPENIWDDGFDLRCSCRRCGRALLKDQAHGWREVDPDIDYSGRGKLRTAGPAGR